MGRKSRSKRERRYKGLIRSIQVHCPKFIVLRYMEEWKFCIETTGNVVLVLGFENDKWIVYTPKSKIKDKVPVFSANLFNSDKIISSSELFKSDKFYLLNIWSSWCVPCRNEHPLLMELSLRKNIELIGLLFQA